MISFWIAATIFIVEAVLLAARFAWNDRLSPGAVRAFIVAFGLLLVAAAANTVAIVAFGSGR